MKKALILKQQREKRSRMAKPRPVVLAGLQALEEAAGVLFDGATHDKRVSMAQHKCVGQIYVSLQMVRVGWKNPRLMEHYARELDGITDKLVSAFGREKKQRGA